MRRQLSPLVAALLAALLAVPAGAAAERRGPPPGDLDRLDPAVHDYDDAIVEHVQVTSRNGVDQLWVDTIRPDTDEPVPTILIASPYYNTLGRGWKGELKTPHQGPSVPTSPGFPGLASGDETPFPEWYDEYFVARGYAVALMDLRGTRNSSGCQVYGDRDEVFDAVDVIDWIAEQSWSNGKVGMTGGSYDGTIAIGAAAEAPISGRHPDALSAIIPIRAIDRWYDYHFFNGVQSQSHALTPALFTAVLAGGDTQNAGTDDVLLPLHVAERKACIATVGAAVDAGYASPYQDARAEFWRERDFTKNAAGFRAATFLIHGLFDYNVKTNNTGYLWEALPGDLPRKLWLFNGDHADPHIPTAEDAGSHVVPFPFQDRFVEATHRWYLQHLKDVEAGATDGVPVAVQRDDGSWDDRDVFPAATTDRVLALSPDGSLTPGEPDEGSVAYRDADPATSSSVTLTTEPLERELELSGQLGFDLLVRAEGPDTTVAASVLALPPGTSTDEAATITHDGSADAPLQASYGWARAWYRDSIPLRGLSSPGGGGPLEPGAPTRLRFGSLYTDLEIPAGWRLAVTFSNAAGGTVPAGTGGEVELLTGPEASRILLPVAEPGRRGPGRRGPGQGRGNGGGR